MTRYLLKKLKADGWKHINIFEADSSEAVTDKIGAAKAVDPTGGYVVEELPPEIPGDDVDAAVTPADDAAPVKAKRRTKGAI